ncbi:MAG: hypothetical protein JRM86_01285 [Nitrososphaerota archaeon]|nr:hypothetical protein [Nitrososphaerota archaeon]
MNLRSGSSQALADALCAADEDIMFCAVVSIGAEILATSAKKGADTFIPESKVRLFVRRWDLVRKIDDTADEFMGPTESVAVFRSKMTLVSVNLSNGGCALMGARPSFDPTRVKALERVARSSLG